MEILRYDATTSRPGFVQELPSLANNPPPPRRESARRRLDFGGALKTCSQEANHEFIQTTLTQMANDYRHKWEFDFEIGQPLPSSSSSRFHYKLIDIAVIPSIYSPLVHSPKEEENLSDSENCPSRLVALVNNVSKLNTPESKDFVLPQIKSPKKVLKKPSNSTYLTPKKARITQLTGTLSNLTV